MVPRYNLHMPCRSHGLHGRPPPRGTCATSPGPWQRWPWTSPHGWTSPTEARGELGRMGKNGWEHGWKMMETQGLNLV